MYVIYFRVQPVLQDPLAKPEHLAKLVRRVMKAFKDLLASLEQTYVYSHFMQNENYTYDSHNYYVASCIGCSRSSRSAWSGWSFWGHS